MDAVADREEDPRVSRLEREKADLQQRLEFVEELVGPTEAQRKSLHEQVLAVRSAALKAKYRGASVPTKVVGRLDERLMWTCGLSEQDAGLLQGGSVPDQEGILQDVSLLGDPRFQPYDQRTGELRWHAKGGLLQLSLEEVQNRFGEDVARDVVRCAKELDKYDASRRVGIELPWHPLEDRELKPAEVISLLERELSLQSSLRYYLQDRDAGPTPASADGAHDHHLSPYAVVNAPPPRQGRSRRVRGLRTVPTVVTVARSPRGVRSAGSSVPENAVVTLPRVDPTRRGTVAPPELRCALPGLRPRVQAALEHPLLRCHTLVF